MKKNSKPKKLAVAPQKEPGVADLTNKVQEQLNIIEKKIDILINQSSQKPFEKSYSRKPFREFNQPQRHDRGRQGDSSMERTYTRVVCAECNKECEIPFRPSGDRPVYCKECFSRRKQGSSFSANRDNRPEERGFHRERSFDKGQGEAGQRYDRKKKPFFHQRKKRG